MSNEKQIPWCEIIWKVAYLCWVFELNLAFYDAAKNKNGDHKSKDDDHFLRVMNANNIFSATLSWCHLFGSRSDVHHWTKILPADTHTTFRAMLHDVAGGKQEWKDYHLLMSKFRNQHVAHIDQNDVHIPEFRTAFKAIKILYDALKESNAGCQFWLRFPDDLSVDYKREWEKASAKINILLG
jgi:hypothetical protein